MHHGPDGARAVEEMASNAHRHTAHPAEVPAEVEYDGVGITQRVDRGVELRRQNWHPDVEPDDSHGFAGRLHTREGQVGVGGGQVAKLGHLAGLGGSRYAQRALNTVGIGKHHGGTIAHRPRERPRRERVRRQGLPTRVRFLGHACQLGRDRASVHRLHTPSQANAGLRRRSIRIELRNQDGPIQVPHVGANGTAAVGGGHAGGACGGVAPRGVGDFARNDREMRLPESGNHIRQDGPQLSG